MFESAIDKLVEHTDFIDDLNEQLEKITDMVKGLMEILKPK